MAEPRKLSIPTMFCFGVGEAAGLFKNMAWGVLLLFYYQQIVGVEAALVGLAIAISVVMDAVTDPLIGAWSDRIKTRWGRRHPMLVASALPLAVSFVFLFAPPEGISDFAGFLWLTTFGVLVRASYTLYNIPHSTTSRTCRSARRCRTTTTSGRRSSRTARSSAQCRCPSPTVSSPAINSRLWRASTIRVS